MNAKQAANLALAANDVAAHAVTVHTVAAHTAACDALKVAAHAYFQMADGLYEQADLHRQAALDLAADVVDIGELDGLAAELGL
jgi:hypothetical protein